MPRTITPEEQERVASISALKNVKPTPNRKVFVDADADGEPNIFLWDGEGSASEADGTTAIESSLPVYASGGTKEGVWRRTRLPFSAATTDDLAEGTGNLYFTGERVRNEFQAGGDVVYDKGFDTAYSLDIAEFTGGSFDTTAEEQVPEGIEFNSDGTRLFLVGSSTVAVYEYELTNPFDISSGVLYSGNSFDVSVNTDGSGLAFNGDGTKMFVADSIGEVYEYTVGTGFDLSSSVSATGNFADLTTEVGTLAGIEFSDTGDKLFAADSSGVIYEYSVGTAFDLSSTVSYTGNSFDVTSQATDAINVTFRTNGTEMFVLSFQDSQVYKYGLGTGYDLSSSVTDTGKRLDTSGQNTSGPLSLEFDNLGENLFVGVNSFGIYQYDTGNTPHPAEFQLDVSELAPVDLFGSKSTDDLPEGTSNLYFTDERAQDAVGTALTGVNGVSVNYDDPNDTITIDASGAGTAVSDDGNVVIENATEIDFSTGLEVIDDGDGTVTVNSLSRFGSATFSGGGQQTTFDIPHGLSQEPVAFVVQARTDDASSISHATADSTNITVVFDTPPPTGTDNIVIDYSLQKVNN